MTPDQWIYVGVGLAVAWWLHRTLAARPAPIPAAQPPPRVLARVVDDHAMPHDTTLLLSQLNHAIEAQGMALAFQRKASEMVEAKAATVTLPWAAPAPPKSDPPKA